VRKKYYAEVGKKIPGAILKGEEIYCICKFSSQITLVNKTPQ
jgi:hypothetical protein